MIAGGVDAPIAPLILRGFQLMRIMSTRWNDEPQRASRPFSRDRDGFVIAEGAWFFVLEEMEQAKTRGAHIYGEVAGYGSTCEAYHRVRLEECGEEPARAMEMAMHEAAIPPTEVQYINYHGTSTELNQWPRAEAGRFVPEKPHRPSARSLRRRRSSGDTAGDARWRGTPHHQSRRGRPELRSGLHPGTRQANIHRKRGGQLHRLWQQELGSGFEACGLVRKLKNRRVLGGFTRRPFRGNPKDARGTKSNNLDN
jgi:hypothetical protein